MFLEIGALTLFPQQEAKTQHNHNIMTVYTIDMDHPSLAATTNARKQQQRVQGGRRPYRTAMTLRQIKDFRKLMRIYLRQSMATEGYPRDMVDEMLDLFPLEDFVGQDGSTVAREFEEFFLSRHGSIWEVFGPL